MFCFFNKFIIKRVLTDTMLLVENCKINCYNIASFYFLLKKVDIYHNQHIRFNLGQINDTAHLSCM